MIIMASNSSPSTSSLTSMPVSWKAAMTKQSLAISFAANVITLPSATKRMATRLAAPFNDDDHLMAAIMFAGVALPLANHCDIITNSPGANIPKAINPYINNDRVHSSRRRWKQRRASIFISPHVSLLGAAVVSMLYIYSPHIAIFS